MNNTATPDRPAPMQLRAPDRKVTENREVRFVWDLAPDPEGGTRQAVLAITYSKGQRGGGSFTATVLNQTERGSERDMGSPLDWHQWRTWQVARYSARQLEDFAAAALSGLRIEADLGDRESIARYFEVTP